MKKGAKVGIGAGIVAAAILAIASSQAPQPDESLDNIGSTSVPSAQTEEISCDPSYPDFCIDPYSADLDCGQIPYKDFRVYQPDPHGFDRDNDGIGCES